MPIGLRGVGKTVLLNRFCELGEKHHFEVAVIEATEAHDFVVKLTGRLRQILLRLESRTVSAKVHRALRILKSFSYTMSDGSSIALDVDALEGSADSGNLSDDLTQLFEAVGEAAADRGVGILLSIDESQYLTAAELGALIASIHRTSQLDLPVVLTGAGLPQLPALTGAAKSYAERLFSFSEIGRLSQADAQEALVLPAREQRVDFTPAAVDAVMEQSDGYPYFLQEWGYRSWNRASGHRITQADVEAATLVVLETLDNNFFRVRYDRLTPADKAYLRAMASLGVGPHRSGDIAAKLGARVESVAPRRGGLIAKGMIWSPAHGDTAFTVPLFNEFLSRVPDAGA